MLLVRNYYVKYQNVCPIGPPPPSPTRECGSPLGPKWWRATLVCGGDGGEVWRVEEEEL